MKKLLFLLFFVFALLPHLLMAEGKGGGQICIVEITPADSSVLAGFSAGDSLTFMTSIDSLCGGFNASLLEKETGEILYEDFTNQKNTDGHWVLPIYKDIVFYESHSYEVKLEGHEENSKLSKMVGEVSATYFGSTEGDDDIGDDDYEYSPVTWVSISPEEGAEFTLLYVNYAVAVFSDDVTIDYDRSTILDEKGRSHQFDAFIPVNGSHSLWQLMIPVSVLQNCTDKFTLRIYVKDKNGRVVKGNKRRGENSFYQIYYTCYLNYPKITVSPPSGEETSLSDFVFSCDKGITIKNGEEKILLYAQDKETIVDSVQVDPESLQEMEGRALRGKLNEVVTTPGEYYLYVPKGVFGLSDDNLDNWESWTQYAIVDKNEKYGVTIIPEEENDVYELSQFLITFNRWELAKSYYHCKDTIWLYNADGERVVAGKATFDSNRTQLNQCIINLNSPVDKPGNYRLIVPEEAFILSNQTACFSEEMHFDYTIVERPDYSMNYELFYYYNYDSSLKGLTIRFNDYSSVGIAASNINLQMTDSLGNVVSTGTLKLGQMQYDLYYMADEDNPLTTKGEYYLRIPAHSVRFDGKIYEKDFTITVPFDPTLDIQLAAADNDNQEWVKVYNIQGQLVREGKACEAFVGLKGLYIVNGKKMYIKSAFSK